MVDYPGENSLDLIYGTFTRAVLRLFPHLRAYANNLTHAMLDVYTASQAKYDRARLSRA